MTAVKTLPFLEAVECLSLPNLERNLFSSSEWLSVLQKTYNLGLFCKYIERDGKVSSYVFYSLVHNFLEDKICICSYCDYCDAHIEREEDWELFFDSWRREHPKYRIAIRNLRDEAARKSPHFQVLSQERHHLLDVRGDLDTIFKKMDDSFRSQIKQAEKSGVVVRPCDKSGLKKFYELHLRLRKNKYRLFPQPYRFFDVIWQGYMEKDKGVLLGAFDAKGRFIGGTVYLICGNTLYYKFNTSALDALKERPNNILLWEGIKFAKNHNLEFIDVGSSGLEQKGLIMFKEHAGAQGSFITHLGYHPPGYKFSQKRILKAMTWFFTLPWMPNFMLRLGSDIIYHYLA